MSLSHAFKFSTSCLMLLSLVGCAGLTMQKPETDTVVLSEIDIPSLWKSAGEGNNGQIASGWLKSIKDPEMSAMVNEALQHNQNLKVAAARLRAAREDRKSVV